MFLLEKSAIRGGDMTADVDIQIQVKNGDSAVASTTGRSGWVIALVATISMARIGHGLFLAITGPTLLFLAQNTQSDVGQVSVLFSGRSAGILVGEICFGAFVKRFAKVQSLLCLGIGLGLNGVVLLISPFLTSLAGLVIVNTLGGWLMGYLDAGLQVLYLKSWGEKGSRPYIQSFHFAFSVGAFLAPVIATPFLTMANQESLAGTRCLDVNVTFPTVANAENVTDHAIHRGNFNPIYWCFIIPGTYTALIAVLMCGLALCNVEHKVATRQSENIESRPEEPFKDLWMIFIPICLYYFCCVSSEMVYQGYIYAVALCSNLNFRPEEASWLTAVFSAGFGFGRSFGIVASHYVKPSTIIKADLIGTTGVMILMSMWGEQSSVLTWIVTFVHGFACASLYPSGVSWSSRVTNMSESYILVFAVGATAGSFVMMPVAGAIYEKNSFSVMYLIAGTCVTNVIVYIFMNVAAKSRCTLGACFTYSKQCKIVVEPMADE